MKIRFCEFCGKVAKEEEFCDICGCPLSQDVEEEEFNNSENPWPFTPVTDLTLRIQGKTRKIHFEGTHSLFHLWTEINRAYSDLNMYFHLRGKDEILLAAFPAGCVPPLFRPLDPGDILNCTNTRFSCYGYTVPDRELGLTADPMIKTYQGTFDILECPAKDIPFVLGWLLSNGPEDRCLEGWVYDI